MEAIYTALTNRALSVFQDAQKQGLPTQRVLITVSGTPGSGKSTVAQEVAQRINALSLEESDTTFASIVPMDGFHFPRQTLDRFSDPSEAHARRGAPWTFDAGAILDLVHRLRETCSNDDRKTIKTPSFDHATKDPLEDDIWISPTARIVILEGNYLLLNEEPWSGLSDLVDDTWFVKVKRETARRRIVQRHLQAGIEDTFAAAIRRAEYNDLPNGELVLRSLVQPKLVLESVDNSF